MHKKTIEKKKRDRRLRKFAPKCMPVLSALPPEFIVAAMAYKTTKISEEITDMICRGGTYAPQIPFRSE